MTNRKMFCILGMAAICLPILTGCGGKGADTTTTAASTGSGPQAMLNNPNVSEADKEKIRKSMGGAGSTGTAGSGGAATSGDTKSGQ